MIARVTLEIALDREFDYAVPEEFRTRVEVGTRVKVPFGPRLVLGWVTGVAETSEHPRLKPIRAVIGAQSLITPLVIRLARWIGEYYCCPVELVLKSLLPESVRREQAGWKERLVVRLLPRVGDPPKLTSRQTDVITIIEEWKEIPLQELVKRAQTTPATLRKLEDRGLISITPAVFERDPYAHEEIVPTQPLTLNQEQAAALGRVLSAMDAGVSPVAPGTASQAAASTGPGASAAPAGPGEPAVFLLHGVTGSGKTEVYLQAIDHALASGRGAIVLVPEISLTPQTVERFKARFCSGPNQTLVAVLHSHLSAGERHDEWHKIRQGRARIVIGARSAIFAPMERLGLIIVDEEHEHSYKQEESPRYHARDVAVVRARMEGATVVLGSATPSMESYYNALKGKYQLLEMKLRIDSRRLPLVRVVDLRHEMKRDRSGTTIFSLKLKEAILQRLERGEQTMLFLNRRGYATSFQCPKCGYVAECPNCSLTLTYHRREQRLRCHLCGLDEPAPKVCPKPECVNPAVRYAGLGTERVEEALVNAFPKARIERMDSDTLKRKEDYRRILGDFRTGKIDILLGTQMIAKGLHFPNVTLVGIIYADQSLHQPDFRAGERTFQLLTQVSGRAGRGDVEGEVIVQTFTPFHPAIQFARRHDFIGFYEQELEFRQQLRYPPLARVVLILLKGRNQEKVEFCADFVRKGLESALPGIPDLIIAGPAPAPIERAETFYRFQIMLRTGQVKKLVRFLTGLLASLELPEDVTLVVDIDPVNLS